MSRSSTGRWLLAGISAGLALTATMLVVRLWLGVQSLPEQIQDQLLLLIPGGVFSFVLQRLEFTAKPLLFISSIAVIVLASGLAGIVFVHIQQRVTARCDLTRPAPSIVLGLTLWMLVLLGLLPLLGARSMLSAGSADRLDATVMLIVPGAAFGLTLGRVGASLNARTVSASPGAAGFRIDRRAPIAVGLPAVGALVTVGSVERIIRQMHQSKRPPPAAVALTIPTVVPSPVRQPTPTVRSTATAAPTVGPPCSVQPTPPNATPTSPPTPGSPPTPARVSIPAGVDHSVTPVDAFYLVSKNFVDPTLNANDWSLEVIGQVDTPLTLTYANLLALPAVTEYVTLECISNRVGGNLMSTALWTGVPLVHLLSAAGVRPDATTVAFTSADNYVESFPVQTAMAPTTILAYAMNGEPLPYRHGYPLRLLSVGHYGRCAS